MKSWILYMLCTCNTSFMTKDWFLFTWTWRISCCILSWTDFNMSAFTISSKLFFPNSATNTEFFISYHIHFMSPVSPSSVNVTNIYIVAQVKNLNVFYYSFLFLISRSPVHQKILFPQIPKVKLKVTVTQSCLTHWDPMDSTLPDSSVC